MGGAPMGGARAGEGSGTMTLGVGGAVVVPTASAAPASWWRSHSAGLTCLLGACAWSGA